MLFVGLGKHMRMDEFHSSLGIEKCKLELFQDLDLMKLQSSVFLQIFRTKVQ